MPSEPTCLSELLMRIKSYLLNICQHNYFCIQHCYFVNSTQISDVIQRLRFGKSYGIDNIYSDNFKLGTDHFSIVFQLLLIVCYVMDIHPPVCCMLQLYIFPRTLN